MRACPRCGNEHADDVHFCGCGAFLDWHPPAEPDVTGDGSEREAAARTATSTVTAPLPSLTEEPEPVSVWLFRPGDPVDDRLVELAVPAGGRTTVIARVRNQSNIVDSYELSVEGIPDDWWTIDPPTAYLLPLGSREGYEEDVAIAVHPPRSPGAEARTWTFTVTVVSQSHPTRIAHASASVDVEPFWQIAAVAQPPIVRGRRRGTVVGAVSNAGNAPVLVTVSAVDAEDRCRFAVPAAPVSIPPGESRSLPVVVRPKRPLVIGRPLDHRLDLVARTSEEEPLAAPFPAVYRQRPWIRPWVPVLLLALALIALLLYLLWPQRVEVPDVRKARSAFAAQKRLEKEGLRLNPQVRTVVRPRAKPGSVVDQAPAAGKTVDEGDEVAIRVAAGRGRTTVPPLAKLKVVEAEKKLKRHGLTLGAVEPELDPQGVVATQLPEAGVKRRRGTPVSVVLAKPKPKPEPKEDKPGAKAAATAVPAVAGKSAEEAAAALAAAGLDVSRLKQIDASKPGTVVGTDPPPGAPPRDDKTVDLIISAGFPDLAFNDFRGDALVVGGADGSGRRGNGIGGATLTTGGAWAPGGGRIAYVSRGGDVFVETPGSGRPRRLVWKSEGRREAVYAAFAPRAVPQVLAFVTRGPGTGDEICWTGVEQGSRADCLKRPGWTLRGIAWHPLGTELLVPATGSGGLGLLRFVTSSGASRNAADWRRGGRLVTKAEDGRGVRAAAFSPDGTKLALVSNLERADYRLAVVDADVLEPDAAFAPDEDAYLPVQACEVTWRADSAEVAVVQEGGCPAPAIGPIVRLDPDDARTLRTIAVRGEHPSWEPMEGFSPGPAP